jgi:hypothetical protein
VATPPKRLRAHKARSRLRQRRGERPLPPVSTHAGGIAAECGDAKAAKDILARLASEAAAKLNCVPIGDPTLLEHRCKRCLVELRIVTGAWKASHVDEGADARRAKNRDELPYRPSSMADRPDDHQRKDASISVLRA